MQRDFMFRSITQAVMCVCFLNNTAASYQLARIAN